MKIVNLKDCIPGHSYCCVNVHLDHETGEEYESLDDLVYFGSDGNLYAHSNAVGEPDDTEPFHGYWDYLIAQDCGVNPNYVW